MPDADAIAALEVSENVRRVLTDVVLKAREVFAADLLSVVLYGSAAAGQMRLTSDVNLLLVLQRWESPAGERMSETLRMAEAAVALKVMFLLETEVADAATAFALKFADITDRHVLLHGRDPFAALAVPRPAKIFRLKQVLLNLFSACAKHSSEARETRSIAPCATILALLDWAAELRSFRPQLLHRRIEVIAHDRDRAVAGDHSSCLPRRCASVAQPSSEDLTRVAVLSPRCQRE